jgi:hypothetical protein
VQAYIAGYLRGNMLKERTSCRTPLLVSLLLGLGVFAFWSGSRLFSQVAANAEPTVIPFTATIIKKATPPNAATTRAPVITDITYARRGDRSFSEVLTTEGEGALRHVMTRLRTRASSLLFRQNRR